MRSNVRDERSDLFESDFAIENQVKTLADAIRYLCEEQTCIDTVASMRRPNGPECPACLMPRERQHWLKKQRLWQCRDCGRQYSVKLNTLFEDSPVLLTKRLPALWLPSNAENGISSYELHRALGVTQKSAWFMLHRIRLAMETQSFVKLGGPESAPVEADETFIGGKVGNLHRSREDRTDADRCGRAADRRQAEISGGGLGSAPVTGLTRNFRIDDDTA